jgi:hypothetical protein
VLFIALLLGLSAEAGLGAAVADTSTSGSHAAVVLHAQVSTPGGNLNLWQDTTTLELAVHLEGDDTTSLVEGHVLLLVESGVLTEWSTYVLIPDLWRRLMERYGINERQVQSALANGQRATRPALMSPPPSHWHGDSTYTTATHFGSEVGDLRRSVHFWVPSPGDQLLGMRVADAERLRVLGPAGTDSGLIATVIYSADPAREGTGERELLFETCSLTSSIGRSDAVLFSASHDRIVGPGFEARFVRGEPLLPHAASYLTVVPEGWVPTRAQWREALVAALG